jgi:hypothetical protein
MGLSNVDLQAPGRDDPAGDVELNEVSVLGFGTVGQSEDSLVA